MELVELLGLVHILLVIVIQQVILGIFPISVGKKGFKSYNLMIIDLFASEIHFSSINIV